MRAYTSKGRKRRKSGGSVIAILIPHGIFNDSYTMNLSDEDEGSGRTTSPSRRSLAHGRHKLTSWTVTQNTAL
jgi:hypothetical protein